MSNDLRACPKCNERDAFQRRGDGSWYCLYAAECGYTENAMVSGSAADHFESRKIALRGMCAKCREAWPCTVARLERELGEAREALPVAAALEKLAEWLDKDDVALHRAGQDGVQLDLRFWARQARAALAPKEVEAEEPLFDQDALNAEEDKERGGQT